jgi:hypothetical protein
MDGVSYRNNVLVFNIISKMTCIVRIAGAREEGRPLYTPPKLQLRPCNVSITSRVFNTAHRYPSTAVFLLNFTPMCNVCKIAVNADRKAEELLDN